MERSKKVIYIPYWISGMLERNNLPLTMVLNYAKMAEFLSLQEQANLLLFQNVKLHRPILNGKVMTILDEVAIDGSGVEKEMELLYIPNFDDCNIGFDSTITDYAFGFQLSNAWKESVSGGENANNSALKMMVNNAESLSFSDLTKEDVIGRFNPQNVHPLLHNHPFITYDLEREYVVVVIFPSFFAHGAYFNNLHAMTVAVLKVLYAYNSYASVCKTPFFRQYLEKLDK